MLAQCPSTRTFDRCTRLVSRTVAAAIRSVLTQFSDSFAKSTALSLWTRSVIPTSPSLAIDQVRRERDLYRRLLDLGAQTEIRPLLAEALGLMVEVLGARLGY